MSLECLVDFSDSDLESLVKSPYARERENFVAYALGKIPSIATVYEVDQGEIKKAILSFPQFAGLDHERVVRQKCKLGSIVSISKDEVFKKIFEKPVLAGYATKRFLAGLDIGRTLQKEGFKADKKMLQAFFSYYSTSPYVPGHKRKRIAQVINGDEPALLKKMRKRLQ